jgi:hypothetical protein
MITVSVEGARDELIDDLQSSLVVAQSDGDRGWLCHLRVGSGAHKKILRPIGWPERLLGDAVPDWA